MPKIRKNKKTANKKIYGIVDPSVRSYENDPFFVKKAAEAKELLKKVGMPAAFYEKK